LISTLPIFGPQIACAGGIPYLSTLSNARKVTTHMFSRAVGLTKGKAVQSGGG
jgi:hypothetical protein